MNYRFNNSVIITMLLICFCALPAIASKSPTKIRIIDPVTIKVMDYAFPDESDFYLTTNQPAQKLDRSSNSIGFGWTIGTTYYDWQHNGSMHRQVESGSSASCPWTAHFTWMMLPSGILADRLQLYNGWDGSSGAPVGQDWIDPTDDYSGYGSLDVTDDNRFVITAHNNPETEYRTEVYYQPSCNVPFHSGEMRITDSLNDLGSTCLNFDDAVIWPSVAVQNPPDGDRILHLIAAAFCGGSGASAFLYWQAVGTEGDGNSWTQGYVIDTIHSGEAYDISADEDGNVGITWVGRVTTDLSACDTCSINNESVEGFGFDRAYSDLYMQLNRNYGRGILGTPFDGTTNWWENRVNLTKLNDTATYTIMYPQADLISMWDLAQNFHIAWVAMPSNPTLEDYNYKSRIFHWGENLGFINRLSDGQSIAKIRTVSDAQWDPVNCNPGAFNQNQAKLSITECNNKFYVTWVELNSPMTTGNYNQDDCAQRAFDGDFTGAANGDLFITTSTDGGLTWDYPRPITDSYGGPTGNPNGACDPTGPAGPCPSEHWMSASTHGTDFPVSGPTPDNVVNIDLSYSGSHYFDLAYIDDPEPGGAVFSYGAWYDAAYKWIRIPCYEPFSGPILNCSGGFMGPLPYFRFPDYVNHCEEKQVDYTIENSGNQNLVLTVNIEEDPSAYSSWLGVQGFPGIVVSGNNNTATGQIIINQNGGICSPGTVVRVSGRVLFISTTPDTCIFEVELVVADTVVYPVWDSVTTYCDLQLAVGNNGNFGNQGANGSGMAYTPAMGEWRPDDYDTYLYDGGQVVGWIDQNSGDTVVNWGLFQTGLADSVTILPQGGQSHTTESWADIAFSGVYTSNDTSISMSSKWYVPTDGQYGCNFILKELKVAWNRPDLKDGSALPPVTLGEVVDWDVPGDSTGSNNSSGYMEVSGYDVIYQQGVEMPGYDDSLEAADGGWDNNERFGAIMYLGAILLSGSDTTKVSDKPHGMYSADNSTFVYPHVLGLDGGEVYKNMSGAGSSISDSIYDLHSGVCYVFEYDLAFGDTLLIFTAYVTTLNSSIPAIGLAGALDDAEEFFHSGWIGPGYPCCYVAGDVNCDDITNVSDLTYTVDFMFRGGPQPCCAECADVNLDCNIDISDLTYRVDYMFRGGPMLHYGCF